MKYSDYISINANVRFGKPCINESRITVYDVLGWLASGMTISEIVSDFPELDEIKVKACLAFETDK